MPLKDFFGLIAPSGFVESDWLLSAKWLIERVHAINDEDKILKQSPALISSKNFEEREELDEIEWISTCNETRKIIASS